MRARSTAISVCLLSSALLPKPPPMYLQTTRTELSGRESALARYSWWSNTPWLLSQTVSRSPSHRATELSVSIVAWISQEVS